MNRKHWLLMMCAAGAAMSLQAATITVSNDISTDTTWTNNNTYVLNGVIYVKNGATLTINPGTLIRGMPQGNASAQRPNTPGALIITRGSKIKALGTKAQPIVFTDMYDNHYVGPTPTPGSGSYAQKNNLISQQWGGVILLGKTYLGYGNTSPNANVDVQIEGTAPDGALGKYGGGDDLDDSGVMRYCSIRYGGYVYGTNNEINGLTLGGVGRGTTIEHIEVFQNCDDAFEWFGGTVDAKYLVAWSDGDDGFDWDEGFRGRVQFGLRVQGVSKSGDPSDKGAEMDGGGVIDNAMPVSCPMFYNITMVGHGMGLSPKRLRNTAFNFRDGTGGRWYNSMFLDFCGAIAIIEGHSDANTHTSAKMVGYNYGHYKPGPGNNPTTNSAASLPNYIGYDHAFQTGDKMLEIKNCVFWRFNYPNAFGCPANNTAQAQTFGADSTGDGNKPHLGHGPYNIDETSYGSATGLDLFNVGGSNAWSNTYAGNNFAAPPVAFLQRSTSGVTWSGAGTTFYPVSVLEPNLPNGSPYLTGGRTPPADGFFTNVPFRGAFNNTRMWAGWTVAARLGLIDWDDTNVTEGDYDDPTVIADYLTYTIEFVADDAATTYLIQHTPTLTPANWQTIGTVTGVTGPQKFTDTRPIAGSGFYRVKEQ